MKFSSTSPKMSWRIRTRYLFFLLLITILLYNNLFYMKLFQQCEAEKHPMTTTTNKSSTTSPGPESATSYSKKIQCQDKTLNFTTRYRGNFLVFNNFVAATGNFRCNESVTLTTPADYRFLDNLAQLVAVWKGPISIALYAPGYDFYTTLRSVAYLRNCGDKAKLVKEFVTFHVFFDTNHTPKILKNIPKPLTLAYTDTYNCTKPDPFSKLPDSEMYKAKHQLLYPINVARNIARENSATHFVFASDIELFPTPNFIPKFLKMISRDTIKRNARKVYVLPVFEVLANEKIPGNKTELQKMFKKKTAILFHDAICKMCHRVIGADKWMNFTETEGLNVFVAGKRHNMNRVWEPFYVGTNDEPFFDERLTWEGQSNKMTQAFSLCLLDYDFLVLDNAFLVHKPGVKKKKVQVEKHNEIVQNSKTFLHKIRDELIALFGQNSKCIVTFDM